MACDTSVTILSRGVKKANIKLTFAVASENKRSKGNYLVLLSATLLYWTNMVQPRNQYKLSELKISIIILIKIFYRNYDHPKIGIEKMHS